MTGPKGGFAGKILYVDLTRRAVRQEPLDRTLAEKFVGGLGLTIKLAYDHITPGTEALSPANPIILGAGPLVGTNLPSTSRIYGVTKLPTSKTIGWCGAGGVTFGSQLKNAGFDHIVLEGRADRPVILRIKDAQVDIDDAGSLWGRDVVDTCEDLWKETPWPAGILCIGQGGEALIPYSMAYVNRLATLGRGGFGAVMGSKNLKAIVVQGEGGVEIADLKVYKGLLKEFLDSIRRYPYLKEWQDLGLLKAFPIISAELYGRIKERRVACVSCPIGCKDIVRVRDGQHQGLLAYSSSVLNLFTPINYGFTDYGESIKCMVVLDRYGLDMFEFFGLMAMAQALGEQGVIPPESLTPPIRMGSLSSMESWAEKIIRREGLGAVLAEGFKGVLETFGQEADAVAPALVKAMHPYAGPGAAVPWDLFGTMELGQVLDPRGPHVGASGSPTYFAKRPMEVFPKHMVRMGVPPEAMARILPTADSGNPVPGLRVGRLLKYSHTWFSTLGSLGICARGQINRFYNASLCAAFYEAVTGFKTDPETLRQRVDRVWTLLRLANVREGHGRDYDALPRQWFGEKGFKDYVTEKPLTIEEAGEMIEDYYEEQGWDRKTGVPTRTRLEALGLEECL